MCVLTFTVSITKVGPCLQSGNFGPTSWEDMVKDVVLRLWLELGLVRVGWDGYG